MMSFCAQVRNIYYNLSSLQVDPALHSKYGSVLQVSHHQVQNYLTIIEYLPDDCDTHSPEMYEEDELIGADDVDAAADVVETTVRRKQTFDIGKNFVEISHTRTSVHFTSYHSNLACGSSEVCYNCNHW